jgi:hypothetical protein
MKKLIAAGFAVLLMSACRTTTTTTTSNGPVVGGNETGAADPGSALRAFLAAAKVPDLQAMGAIFGDRDGSARGRIPRDELEKRELVMASCLKHDRFDIIGDAPGTNGTRTMSVNLVKGDRSAAINFDMVLASDRRWYVQSFDLKTLMADYCRR